MTNGDFNKLYDGRALPININNDVILMAMPSDLCQKTIPKHYLTHKINVTDSVTIEVPESIDDSACKPIIYKIRFCKDYCN